MSVELLESFVGSRDMVREWYTDVQFYSKEHEQIGERFARFSFVSLCILCSRDRAQQLPRWLSY